MDKKSENSNIENTSNRGLNRRKALKKILGTSSVVLGFPLTMSAWGQPSSSFGQPIKSSTGNKVFTSSAPSVGVPQNFNSMAPTQAPIECEYLPTSPPTTMAPTEAPLNVPMTMAPTEAPLNVPAPVDPPTPMSMAPTAAPVNPPTPT